MFLLRQGRWDSAETCIKTSPVKSAENYGWFFFFYSEVTSTTSLISSQKLQEPPTWGPLSLNVESGPNFQDFICRNSHPQKVHGHIVVLHCHIWKRHSSPSILFLVPDFWFLYSLVLSLPATQSAATSGFLSFKKNPFSYCQRSHCSQFFFLLS